MMKKHVLLCDYQDAWYLIPHDQKEFFETDSRNVYLNSSSSEYSEMVRVFWEAYGKHHVGMSPRGIEVYAEEHSY